MLQAIPEHLAAFGCEIDPNLAERGRLRTKHPIITGDIFEIPLPDNIAVAFGNPPFQARFIEKLLKTLDPHMIDGGKAGFIIPSYVLQTDTKVVRWNRTWSIDVELLPRTVFPRLSKPIVFATFQKDPQPRLRGMRLYLESDTVRAMRAGARDLMHNGSGCWKDVVAWALRTLGYEAHLSLIYEALMDHRPTSNQWWKEKVRQTLQRHDIFSPRGRGVWCLRPS